MLSYSISQNRETGMANAVLYLDGEIHQARSDHPSYPAIVAGLLANDGQGDETLDYPALFSAERALASKFEVLSDRVSVKNGEVYLDGDIVNGSLQTQIVSFLENGEDFAPLVKFYEKLLSNPLGNVQNGVYDWAQANGLTITDEGDLIGYKSLHATEGGYIPSRTSATGEDRVNGQEVGKDNDILQNVGDVVEMPRSKVLNEPSVDCGDGLHVGTFTYAKGFQGDTVVAVKFSPRDIVSLPDRNSTWKLRVCRYTVLEVVEEALDVPVWTGSGSSDDFEVQVTHFEPVEDDSKGDLDGARYEDWDGDEGTLTGPAEDGYYTFTYDSERYGSLEMEESEIGGPDDELGEETGLNVKPVASADNSPEARAERRHGKGGRHSKAAEGNGLNVAQDPKTGLFTQGRPGSQRDDATGRFSA